MRELPKYVTRVCQTYTVCDDYYDDTIDAALDHAEEFVREAGAERDTGNSSLVWTAERFDGRKTTVSIFRVDAWRAKPVTDFDIPPFQTGADICLNCTSFDGTARPTYCWNLNMPVSDASASCTDISPCEEEDDD